MTVSSMSEIQPTVIEVITKFVLLVILPVKHPCDHYWYSLAPFLSYFVILCGPDYTLMCFFPLVTTKVLTL